MTPLRHNTPALQTIQSAPVPSRYVARTAHSAAHCLLLFTVVSCGREAELRGPGDAELPVLQLSADPALVIGDDGSSERAFTSVSARRLPDGSVAVADHGSSVLLLFDRSGVLRRSLARPGKGPGELSGDFLLTSQGDTVFTFGQPPASPPVINSYTASGGFLERLDLRQLATNTPFRAWGRFTNGALAVTRGSGMRILRSLPEPGTLTADSATLGILSSGDEQQGGPTVWLRTINSGWRFAFSIPTGRLRTGTSDYPLRGATHAVVSGDKLWLVNGQSGEISTFHSSGELAFEGKLSLPSLAFDDEALARRRDADLKLAMRPLDSARVAALFDPKLRPDRMPLVAASYSGPAGELWLQLFDIDLTAPKRFLILDATGAEVARAQIPGALQVQQIGAGFVLGIQTDSLGVESIVEYTLHRNR